MPEIWTELEIVDDKDIPAEYRLGTSECDARIAAYEKDDEEYDRIEAERSKMSRIETNPE